MLEKKKPILCWQMVASVLLLFSVLASSFLAHIRMDESDLADLCEGMTEEMQGVKGALTGAYGMQDDEDKELYIEQVKSKSVNYLALAKIISETGMKSEFSFTGWETIFLTEPMIAEKIIRVMESGKGKEGAVDQMRDQARKEGGFSLCKMNEYFGHMRAGYFLLYVASAVLIIMFIVWYVKKRDGRVLVITNLIVSVGGICVTVFGTQGIGKHGVKLFEWAVARTTTPDLSTLAGSSTLTAPAGTLTGTLCSFEKVLQDFGAAITSTPGNTICTLACIGMFIFAVYMTADYCIFAKRRVLQG